MNILNTRKSFQDVKVDEKIYILDPQTQKIISVTVVKSFLHPKSKYQHIWVIEAYLPFRLNYITDEKLKEASKFGTQVTQQMFLPKTDVMSLLVSKAPTVVSTEETYIKQWMAKQKSGLILPKRNW